MLTKTFGSKDTFKKSVVFGIILLCIELNVLQQIQSTVKADLTNELTYPDDTTLYIGYPPIILLQSPNEGEILKETILIQWTAQDSEDGTNLSIYLYLSNANGDNCLTFLNNPYENTGELLWNTTQCPDGEYQLLIESHDSDGNISIDSCNFQIKNYEEQPVNNEPMKPDQPFGIVYGKLGKEYSYTTSTIDSDGALVYYLWDWSNGNNSGWLGPYHCGVTCQAKHTWTETGTYNVTVKAKDVYGKESVWSDPLSITIPYSYKPIFQFLELVFHQFPYAFPLLQKLLRN